MRLICLILVTSFYAGAYGNIVSIPDGVSRGSHSRHQDKDTGTITLLSNSLPDEVNQNNERKISTRENTAPSFIFANSKSGESLETSMETVEHVIPNQENNSMSLEDDEEDATIQKEIGSASDDETDDKIVLSNTRCICKSKSSN